MIEEIVLENFKIFEKETRFSGLKKFNLFTGTNGKGKSSALQPMLLFSQTLMQNKSAKWISLNGNLVSLGTTLDVKSRTSRTENLIRIGFKTQIDEWIYNFSAANENRQILDIESIDVKTEKNNEKIDIKTTELNNFSPVVSQSHIERKTPMLGDVIYISADRIGPRLNYETNPSGDWIGQRGEYAVQLLFNKNSEEADNVFISGIKEIFPETDFENISYTVGGMVDFWLSKMFGNTSIEVNYQDDTNLYVLKISTEKLGNSYKFKPTDVGFGYSYVLPILVAGLAASKDSILIIENPEAHLHPAAQSVVTKFLALVAKRGVQVFVESHSEHILNALRVMVAQKKYSNNDVNILYFQNQETGYFEQINIAPNGKLSNWPVGFFDQTDRDLDILLTL